MARPILFAAPVTRAFFPAKGFSDIMLLATRDLPPPCHSAFIFAARMKSFMDNPPILWVDRSSFTLL